MLGSVIPQTRRLLRNEGGGAYTLSYVMVIPVLMLLTCVIVETTLVMSARIGTAYAAYSGARTAVVWSSATDDWSDVENRVEQAVVQSFVPFASGMGQQDSPPGRSADYVQSYTSFADQAVPEAYIRAKYANAASRLQTEIDGRPAAHDSEISVTVKYRFRFNIPGIGKLLGEPDGDGYSFPVESTVTLQNEGPRNATQDLGIGYGQLD